MNLRKLVAVTACGACLTANFAAAQQTSPKAPQGQPVKPVQTQPGQPVNVQVQPQPGAGQVGQQTQWKNSDHQLASCIAIANQEEIAIAKMAEGKAKNNEVKEFAKMLVKDHSGFLQKLQRFAPEATQDGFLNDQQQTVTNQNQTTSTTQPKAGVAVKVQPAGGQVQVATDPIQQTAAVGENAQAGQHLDFMQLHREIAEECIRSAKHAMSKKDGTAFDECFVGMQIAAHAEMKTKLTVFERHATGDLKQIIATGIETTEKHKKRAEELMKNLNDSGNSVSKSDSKN